MSVSHIARFMNRNVRLFPWFRFLTNLSFWQAIWFLFFQDRLSASEAILMYAIYDITTTALEVPSGYMSDRLGRRLTLVLSAIAQFTAMLFFVAGDSFMAFAIGQMLLGAGAAFASGTDSSFLYESLVAEGRGEEIEDQELRAWRFSFAGLALSAVTGGLISLWSFEAAFAMSAVAMAGAACLAFWFVEPPHEAKSATSEADKLQLATLKPAFAKPVLLWLFSLGVLMYGFSHIPFVFGQPFILEALNGVGLAGEAPLVSGAVTTVMMLVSVAVSLVAPKLRKRIGLGALLLFAFALQIGIAAALAITGTVAAIGVLFLRMVPSSLSGPFIIARMQPLLNDESRATFLSLKSLVGRLLFSASLWLAASQVTDVGLMTLADIQFVLKWYVGVGCVALCALAFAATRIQIEATNKP